MNKPELALSTRYFSKEFPANWEVEWKANLATKDPHNFIVVTRERASTGLLEPFHEAKFMGNMPTGIQYQNLWFHYYGHIENGFWIRDLVLVQPPGTPILIPQFKEDVPDLVNAKKHNIVLRAEKKGGLAQVFPLKKLDKFLEKFQSQLGHGTQLIGTIDRERYSVYLTNRLTRRNFSLVADVCHEPSLGRKNTLSQVEVEYKGISGISAPSFLAQAEILKEFDLLGSRIQALVSKDIVKPTTVTKLDWLVKALNL